MAILTIPALRLEAIDRQDPVQVGGTTTYTITVRNQGSGEAKDIQLSAVLPEELSFIQWMKVAR